MNIITRLAAIFAAATLAMSPAFAQKLGDITAASTVNATDKIPASQNGTTAAITPAQIATFLAPTFEAKDADLDAIAALSTTAFGRNLLGIIGPIPASMGGTGDTGSAWSVYSPTITCASGSASGLSGVERYKSIGKTVFITVNVYVSTVGACTGPVSVSLPISASASAPFAISGGETNIAQRSVWGRLNANASSAAIFMADGSSPAVANYNLVLTGTYESN